MNLRISQKLKHLERVDYRVLKEMQGDLKNLTKDNYARLKKSLTDFGWRVPFFVWKNNGTFWINDGHQRVRVLRKEQATPYELPYIEIEASSLEEAKQLLLVISSQYGTITQEGFDTFTADINGDWLKSTTFFDALFGLGKESPKIVEDEVPEPPKVAITKPGDLWILGDHRLLCGDSTSKEHGRQVIGGSLGHMIFTDPPYGVNYTGGMKKRDELANDNVGTEIYAKALPVLAGSVDNEAPLYLWYADGHAAAAAAAAAAAGYQITAQIIWAKNHAQFVTSAHYKGKHEPCYYGHKKGHTARWHGPNNEVTLWEEDRAASNDFHPTQKPVALGARAIKNSTESGQIVCDFFGGSGSTLIAAEQLNRKCYAIEIEPKYCDVIIERWENLSGGKAKKGTP